MAQWVQSLSWEDPLKKEMTTHSTLDRGASWVTVIGIAKSWTRLKSDNLSNDVIFLKKEKKKKIYIYIYVYIYIYNKHLIVLNMGKEITARWIGKLIRV